MSNNVTTITDPLLGTLTYGEDVFDLQDRDTNPPTSLERPSLPANFAKLSKGELESLLHEQESLSKNESARLDRLWRKDEIHLRFAKDVKDEADEAEQHLETRNGLIMHIKNAINSSAKKAQELKVICEDKDSSLSLAASSNVFDPREMMSALAQGKPYQFYMGGYCKYKENRVRPLPNLPLRRAVKFTHSSATPQDLFVHHANELSRYEQWPDRNARMIRRTDPKNEILVYTDGCCLDQHISGDTTTMKAGCAVILHPEPQPANPEYNRGLAFRLETHGPTGQAHPQTSNRAELRAAIAAVECSKWVGKGWIRVTVATDSAYVVGGITEHIATWSQREWHNSSGKPVANRDLWERLLSAVDKHAWRGVEIRFWLIGRNLNQVADAEAKAVAGHGSVREGYMEFVAAD